MLIDLFRLRLPREGSLGAHHGSNYYEHLRLRPDLQVSRFLITMCAAALHFTFSYVLRVGGSFFGALAGLLAWYLGKLLLGPAGRLSVDLIPSQVTHTAEVTHTVYQLPSLLSVHLSFGCASTHRCSSFLVSSFLA